MGRGIALPAKALMLGTTVVSTLVSFVGGLIMYLEGLRIMEGTVREISQVELQSTARKLNSTIVANYEASSAYYRLLTNWDGYTNASELQRFLQRDQFARIRSSTSLYGIGVFAVPMVNTIANRSGFVQMVWYDPLADGSRDFISAYYFPSHWGTCVDPPWNDTSLHRCIVCDSMDAETGHTIGFAYTYSDYNFIGLSHSGRWARQQVGWEQDGAVWWRAPDLWRSKDGTPYVFGTFVRTAKLQPPDHPVWGAGYKLTIMTYNLFNEWEVLLRQTDGRATLVATFLDAGLDSQAIASNTGGNLMQPGCNTRVTASGRNPCLITIRDLRPDILEACVKSNKTEEGYFFRTSIGGSEHWVMRLAVHRTREKHDEMATIHLVWLRKVSTVESELNRALYFFVGFVAAVFLFDIAVFLVEVRSIAKPLAHLGWVMEPIDRMDLAASSARLQGADNRCINVTEVERLFCRFSLTLAALTTYKAFLPQSCLHRDDEEAGQTNNDDPHCESQGSARLSLGSVPSRAATDSGVSRRSLSQESPQCRSPQASAKRRESAKSAWVLSKKGSHSVIPVELRNQAAVGAQTLEPRRKVVSLLAANKRGFLKGGALADPRSTGLAVGAAVGRFAGVVRQHKGNVDLVSGDHHFASFDAAHRCPGHRMAALACAWSLRDEHGALSTAGVCCGPALCGDFGDATMMRSMVLGGLPCVLLAVERIAAQRGIEVLMDSRVHQDAAALWSCQLIDRVRHPKLAGTFTLWRAVALVESKNQEWMYDLADQTNPFASYNTIMDQVFKGELGAAKEALAVLSTTVEDADGVSEVPLSALAAASPEESPPRVCVISVDDIQHLRERLTAAEVYGGRANHSLVQECTLVAVEPDEYVPTDHMHTPSPPTHSEI
eukprot:TRINITY_DN6699_c0_g3_i2.p1 TRINITY_DN6699_c0_g3~~TRINITY_DN6699_c0_g3_i2.p1  ORF type:complete len:916 (+),score=135.06 TRINITY_DN6699_c0_g3_i2:81-2750(+)